MYTSLYVFTLYLIMQTQVAEHTIACSQEYIIIPKEYIRRNF
jgi:hypothetical protein